MLFETPQQVNLSDSVKNIQTSTGNKGAFLVHKKHICLGLMLFTVCSSYHCLPCGFWFMTKKASSFSDLPWHLWFWFFFAYQFYVWLTFWQVHTDVSLYKTQFHIYPNAYHLSTSNYTELKCPLQCCWFSLLVLCQKPINTYLCTGFTSNSYLIMTVVQIKGKNTN